MGNNPNIWAFVQQTTKEIENTVWSKTGQDNLSLMHRKALVYLQKNVDIVIKPTEKGGNLVIMNRENYEQMCMIILLNREWYRPISKTVIHNYCMEYRNIIHKAFLDNIIDKQTWNYLNIKDPKIPTFYALPKVHTFLTNPPGRPNISGCGSLADNASSLVDSYLHPHVKSLFSYLQDTIDLLKVIEGIHIPNNAWLVTIDVESLYNTIPHEFGLKVIAD